MNERHVIIDFAQHARDNVDTYNKPQDGHVYEMGYVVFLKYPFRIRPFIIYCKN